MKYDKSSYIWCKYWRLFLKREKLYIAFMINPVKSGADIKNYSKTRKVVLPIRKLDFFLLQ